jgi:hydrogenase nickel incorporation protein HypA/HybF
MGIAIEVYRACRQAVAEHGDGRIEKVRLAVGELSAVEPDLIEFAWQALIADTGDAGAALEITWCPAQQVCEPCGEAKPRSEGSWLRLCPDCGHPLQVTGGDELDVLEVTFETENDDHDHE